MTQEYDEGPWIDVPEGSIVQTLVKNISIEGRYRIITPKPKRKFVVGKWYMSHAGRWRRVIAVECGKVWFSSSYSPGEASIWNQEAALGVTDWSVPPRDECPE